MPQKPKHNSPVFQLGDRVRIRYSDWEGPIVELRGPLGPGGSQIYRIELEPEPEPKYIEVREDQLIMVKPGADNRWGIHRTPVSAPPQE